MLKTKLTENYTGITITGDYDELNTLYDTINNIIRRDSGSYKESIMQNHLYGFLYDVRHGYQGDREIELINNGLDEYKRDCFDIKKEEATDNNLYYSFNVLLPDLILDMILIKFFINKYSKKLNDIYDENIHYVNYFYSIVLNSLLEVITINQLNKIRRSLTNAFIDDKIFIPQWGNEIDIDYILMSKTKRKKEIMHILDKIINYRNYDEFFAMKKNVEKYAKENNIHLQDVYYRKFPNDIKW